MKIFLILNLLVILGFNDSISNGNIFIKALEKNNPKIIYDEIEYLKTLDNNMDSLIINYLYGYLGWNIEFHNKNNIDYSLNYFAEIIDTTTTLPVSDILAYKSALTG